MQNKQYTSNIINAIVNEDKILDKQKDLVKSEIFSTEATKLEQLASQHECVNGECLRCRFMFNAAAYYRKALASIQTYNRKYKHAKHDVQARYTLKAKQCDNSISDKCMSVIDDDDF